MLVSARESTPSVFTARRGPCQGPGRPATIWRRDRACAGSHHRRRRRRRQHRVPPHGQGVARRRAPRARRADQRVDVPLGGTRRAAPVLGRADAAHDVERRVLPAPRGRDRARPRVEGDGQPPARLHARAGPRAPAAGRLGQDLRASARGDRAGGRPAALSGDGARRGPRRRVPADGRTPRPERPRHGAGRGRAAARRGDPHRHARAGHRRPGRPRAGSSDDRGDHSRRRRGERRRDVRAGDRPDGGRDDPARPDGAPVPRHQADRRGARGHADAPGPGPPRLLPRGGRGAGGRRATSGRRRRGGSTGSRPTSTTSCSRRTGSASLPSWRARCTGCPRSGARRSSG